VNESFSEAYEQSIERKQIAEQDALASKNKLEQVKFEAEQRIAQAEAEAKAIQIQAQAITQQGGQNYVQLKAVEKWNGVLPNYMMANSPVPFLNLTR
jgi:regulator of protease activity HflC (stomatin/prohibitin superfamily)